jgi:ribosome recycling factor
MTDEYLEAMNDDFKKAIEAFKKELGSVRTGQASPQLLDSVQVHVAAYGSTMPLKQLAKIAAPDARLLTVNPWDKGTIKDIEKAILSSGLGLNPSSDGQLIRLPIPPLTGERRQQLVRLVRKMTETCKVRTRQVRREYNDIFREMESDKDISQDELKRLLELVQIGTNSTTKQIEGIAAVKEKEVLEV